MKREAKLVSGYHNFKVLWVSCCLLCTRRCRWGSRVLWHIVENTLHTGVHLLQLNINLFFFRFRFWFWFILLFFVVFVVVVVFLFFFVAKRMLLNKRCGILFLFVSCLFFLLTSIPVSAVRFCNIQRHEF